MIENTLTAQLCSGTLVNGPPTLGHGQQNRKRDKKWSVTLYAITSI